MILVKQGETLLLLRFFLTLFFYLSLSLRNLKIYIMLKNISNLGSTLNKTEQQSINGGGDPAVNELCVPLPREATICLLPINPHCCGLWD